jgi:hypothetical protein
MGLLNDMPDDIFLAVRRSPERDSGRAAGVSFVLFQKDRPKSESIFFWTNELRAGDGLSRLDVIPKVEKLLKNIDRIK